MTERPILFSAPMVRAILDESKTQTRRVVRKQFSDDAVPAEVPATSPEGWQVSGHSGRWWDDVGGCDADAVSCPFGTPGDRLWVREAWRTTGDDGRCDDMPPRDLQPHAVWYEADGMAPLDESVGKLRPGMFMPRWASRITLEVIGVRVEQLNSISESDAQSEGCSVECMTPTGDDSGSAIYGPGGYRALWESINGAGSWDANPWVWVIEFKRLTT